MKKKILFIFGTRPEAIKMAPLIEGFGKEEFFENKVCVTAQHRQMLDQVLDFFSIKPDYDLNLMVKNQTLFSLTGMIITKLEPILEDFAPDYVFVHGDTTTSMAASIAAFYYGAKVCHVEAGLRTNNKYSPFPEEINRRITGVIADYHFAPTENSKLNLIKENVQSKNILVTGNTVIDALKSSLSIISQNKIKEVEDFKNEYDHYKSIILVTGHRRENHGQGFLNICKALKQIAFNNPDKTIIYPVHLNPNVKKPVFELLSGIKNILLIEPLSYPVFVWLMNKSKIILTDSGGVQEEAPSLGKPVLVLRETTERPEAVDAGTVILVGTEVVKIINETQKLIDNCELYEKMSQLHNPYGDGKATKRIIDFLVNLNNKINVF
jgi:UDP-N-acetylglucosamine 2-epimerase (non-hydrolysing)